jgi:hypothetical protein
MRNRNFQRASREPGRRSKNLAMAGAWIEHYFRGFRDGSHCSIEEWQQERKRHGFATLLFVTDDFSIAVYQMLPSGTSLKFVRANHFRSPDRQRRVRFLGGRRSS